MYRIKQLPEDFIVREINNIKILNNGQYAYYILKKINYTTVDALQILSKKFKMPLKNIGFAGNKDKHAVTQQKISIFRGSKSFENIQLKNIELEYLGNGKEPISLGDLKGNEFFITLRNLGNNEIEKIKSLASKKIRIPNFFGLQRFSKNNHLVGKAVITRDFKKAIEMILENNGHNEIKIKEFLEINKNNYVGALRLIPLKTRKLFVHSYQSFLFNEIVREYLKIKKERNIKIPIIGFNFKLNAIKNETLRSIISNLLNSEKINPRDFIINQMPELTSEGSSRNLFFQFKFKVFEISQDELNNKMQKARINFILPKSAYATTALEFIFLNTSLNTSFGFLEASMSIIIFFFL